MTDSRIFCGSYAGGFEGGCCLCRIGIPCMVHPVGCCACCPGADETKWPELGELAPTIEAYFREQWTHRWKRLG